MKKSLFLFLLKLFILLSPIPFGCVGRVFSPLFYLYLLILSFIGINLVSIKDGLNSTSIIYEKWIKRFIMDQRREGEYALAAMMKGGFQRPLESKSKGLKYGNLHIVSFGFINETMAFRRLYPRSGNR